MRIYNGKVIVPGLAGFVVAVTFPFWINAVRASKIEGFQSKMVLDDTKCLDTKENMRATHMQQLIQWRDEVARMGNRTPVKTLDGQPVAKSLTDGCMKCHAKSDTGPYKATATYCNDCHAYAGVTVYCWECHNDPGVNMSPSMAASASANKENR